MSKLDNVHFSVLNQLYGKLLTNKQQTMLLQYYDDDLSLGEIAHECNVSRQAVRNSILKAQALLLEFEQKLNLTKLLSNLATLKLRLEELDVKDPQIMDILNTII